MSSPYTGANTYHPTITIPSDGDTVNASAVNIPYEALADNTTFLKNEADTTAASLAVTQAQFAPFLANTGYFLSGASHNAASPAQTVTFGGTTTITTTPVNVLASDTSVGGDRFQFTTSGNITCVQNSGVGALVTITLEASQNGGGYATIPGASIYLGATPGAGFIGTWYLSFALCGELFITTGGTLTYRVKMVLDTGRASTGDNVTLDSYSTNSLHLRL